MDDKTLQQKLNRFVRLGNELDAEAKRRWGEEGLLFHEGDGGVVLMDILPEDNNKNDHVLFCAEGIAFWGAGAF